MLLLVLVLLAIGGIVAPLLLPTIPDLWALSGGVFAVLAILLWMVQKFYVKASANLAYVVTGAGGRARVILDGGGFVIPLLHNKVAVSLETMKLDVERTGHEALITRDNLRVDVKGEFYIKVEPSKEDILAAARSLGEKSVHAESVKALVFEKLVSALRSVAATKDLVDIHAKRDEFASAVQDIVRTDLKHNGLTLESVTISKLDQTDPRLLSDENIFDAQGKKKITQITAEARVERNRLELEAQRAIKQKEVETAKEILHLEREKAEAEATQARDVANIRAERKREQEQFAIEQERAVQEAAIAKEQAVQEARIRQEQAVQEAEVAKDLAVRSKAIERDKELIRLEQERQQADIEREKAVEISRRQKEIAIAQQEAARAEAERQALEAQAAREAAEQKVLTVQAQAEAEREAAVKLIAAKQVIEQDKIRRQTDVEVEAYKRVKEAEAELEAAKRQAEAKLELAQAEAEARMRIAEGEKAQKMVDVDVERERVEVERARVEVERQALENKQTFERAALQFELAKLSIQAEKETRVAMAQAIGEFLSRGEYRIYGDPTTLSSMMQQLTRGLSVGMLTEGVMAGMPEGISTLVSQAVAHLNAALSHLAQAQGDGARRAEEGTENPSPEAPGE